MKTITSSLVLGLALLVFAYLAILMGSTIADNLRVRASEPMKIHPIFYVPDFMGIGSFMTTGWAFLSGTLGVGLLLLACAMHLRWSTMNAVPQIERKSAEQAGASDGDNAPN